MSLRKKSTALLLGGMVMMFLASTLPARGAGMKIKVIVENATVRLNPSLDSEALEENIELGKVLTAEKKVGEWFEVKIQSQLGVILMGYIHEMYVEVVSEEEAPPPQAKEVDKPPVAEEPRSLPMLQPRDGAGQFEVFLGGAFGFGSYLDSSTSYAYDYTALSPLQYLNASGRIEHNLPKPMGIGFSLAYFFQGGFGLRLRVDLNLSKTIEGTQSYDFVWKWYSSSEYSETEEFDVAGSFSVTPISLNAVYKFSLGMISPYLSAGISYFISNLKLDTTLGYAATWTYYNPYPFLWRFVDYWKFPMFVDASLSGLGFNFGAGLDVVLSPMFALTLDLAYFMKGAKEVEWDLTPGRYFATLDDIWYIDLEEADIADYSEDVPKLNVKMSFLRILLGVKILFGS